MRKKVLALALALVMVIAMLPTVAFAADPDPVTDEEELTAALTSVDKNGTVKLGGDITVTNSLSITKSMTLDLNGHKLSGSAVGGLVTIFNNKGTETIALKVIDSSQENKGSIENSAGAAISAVGKDETIQATVELDNGISIKATTQYGAVVNMGQRSKLTVTDAVVYGADSKKAVQVVNNATAEIKGGAFYGAVDLQAGVGNKSITGGYFSEFTASVANCIPEEYGLVEVPTEGAYKDMYHVGKIDSSVQEKAEAKIKLGTEEKSYVYGTLQQLFDLYRGRGKEFEVLKDATLTLDGFGSANAGVFNDANTLKFNIASEKTLTLNAPDTKTAKFEFAGSGSYTVTNVKAADGYTIKQSGSALTCDIDSTSDAIIAVATVGGNTRYLTANNIEAFLSNTKDVATGVTAITFQKNYTLKQAINIPANAQVTIDLGGHTITSNIVGGPALKSISGGKVTLKNGTFDASESGYAISLGITDKTVMEGDKPTDKTEPDTTSKGEAIIGDGAIIKGTISVFNSGSKLTMEKGSSVEAEGFAIAGNGAHDGTEITINNGATVKSNTTAAIYHPQEGKLTIGDAQPAEGVAAPEITGVAGVVVRDGTVTVNDATITATGTGDIKVGDAETTVPAGGIVLDSVTGYGTGDEKVTVKDATVTVKEGQPTVTYTENGETPDYSTESKKPTDHIDVTAGTYQSGEGKADPNMAPFIDGTTNGLSADGEIKTMATITNEDPFLVDFGYLAAAPEKGSDNKWTSPNGFIYTVTDWGDGTFYWCFNRTLTATEIAQNNDKGYAVTFTAPNGESVTDYCHAITSPRFASSLLNKDQLGSAPLTTGNWTIKTGTSEVTVPVEDLPKSVADAAPVVAAANLGEGAEAKDVVVKVTGVDKDGNYIITGTATGLKSHKNGAEPPVAGYWFGVEIKAPTGVTTSGEYEVSGDVTGKSTYDKCPNLENAGGAIIYFNTKDNGTDKYTVTIKWDETHTETYIIDLTGVEHYVEPTPPVSGGTVTPSATVTTPAATNGSYTVSDKNAKAGDTVTVTPKADEGYTVDTVVVTDKDGKDVTVTDNGDGTYSFTMPEKASQPVTVKVTFAKVAPSAKFVDVPQTAWYAEYVDYVVANKLMEGTSDILFSPNMTTNRAMLVTILYRLEGKPAVTKDIPFSDVAAGEWYSDAINWAAANEIVNGYGDDTFRPLRELSREEAAAILYRYAEYKEYDVTATDDLASYTDAGTVSTWADTAMSWAVAEGIIKGTSETKLTPDGTAIRAQAAAMLTRFCENVAK